MTEKITLERKVLSRNDLIAAELRELFRQNRVAVMNLVGSPGSGKTSLLEATLSELKEKLSVAVIEGDLQTDRDAERIARTGVPVHQINTGSACHLEAASVREALSRFDLAALDLLIIENVGNLVCPAAFDLGEDLRVIILSTTEGDDKPLKYPSMFLTAQALVINKVDLLPFTDFSVSRAAEGARRVKPSLRILETSCRTGEGLEEWASFVSRSAGDKRAAVD